MARNTSRFFWVNIGAVFEYLFLAGNFLPIGNCFGKCPGKAKVAYLNLAESVDENVCRLQVSVDNVGRRNKFGSA